MAKPKLCLIPSGVRNDKVYSVLPSNGDGDFDFTRGSTATRVNKDGLIETVDANIPRLDYSDGGCPSLLLEPQRTNQLQRSQEFDNSYWINNGVTITPNNIISPDGTLNADLLTGVSGGFGVVRFSAWTATNKVASCFAKKGSTSTFKITNGSLSYIGVAFNLENGTVTNEDSGFDGSIEDYGNGWYRCTAIDTLGRSGTFSLGVTAASESVYLWGAQLESDYLTSYIPTTTSATSRLAETCNGAGNASTFNDSEGVLFAEISALANDETERYLYIGDGTTANRVVIRYSPTENDLRMLVSSGGSTQVSLGTTNYNITNFNKVALKYKQNDFQLWVNGIKILVDTNGVTPVGINQLSLSYSGVDFYGNTKQLQYFNTALTDSELEDLTSWNSFNEMATAQLYTIS